MKFCDKLNEAVLRNQSLLSIRLDPDPQIWPNDFGPWQNVTNRMWGLQEWLQFLIAETTDLVCAYTLTLEFYRTLGSSGLGLLRQTLAAIPSHIPVILDAQHADSQTSTIFAQMIFSNWQVDAVTLNPYIGQDGVTSFLCHAGKFTFVLCATANPSTTDLQEYPTPQSPFYLNLVEEVKKWGIPEQVGLEIGGKSDIFARVRAIAPERVILTDNVPTDPEEFRAFLTAGLTRNGDGLIISVPPETGNNQSPRDFARSLRHQINQIREAISQESPACSIWAPDVCLLHQHPHKDLILQLYDIGCIHFGEFVQASGATFPYYVDLRTIISHPQVFEQVLNAYADILKNLTFDRIAGIPYGSLPTATGLGLRLNHPIIFPRKEVKAHGTRRLVEGRYREGETIVVIDDILITGKSVMEGIEKLQSVGLRVEDVVVLIDHEGNSNQTLGEQGYRSHSVLTISDIATILYEAGRLDVGQFNLLFKAPH